MKVSITKKGLRYLLSCYRADGSIAQQDVGPSLPTHDLAHYVVETHFGLRAGFFGSVSRGQSIAALNDPQLIRRLGAEAWQAEVLARALTSLQSGACRSDQFKALVNIELESLGIAPIAELEADVAQRLLRQLDAWTAKLGGLTEGGSLSFEFELTS